MKQNIFYFSYGASRSPAMIEAIIGRKPKGFKYELKGYELAIQDWKTIPKRVKKILSRSWDESFRTYFIRKSSKKSVWGVIWKISKREHEFIANWEMHNLWYKPIVLRRKIGNQIFTIRTEILNDKNSKSVKDGKYYSNFPVKRSKILRIAKKARREYLSENL